jgi:TonB family protein
MHPRPTLVAIALLGTMASARAQSPVFKPLLDSGSLAAWDPDVSKNAHVSVDAGVLRLTGESGWVLTKERHSDVVLRFDAKADPNSAGGVLVRVLSGPGSGTAAYEVQLADGHGRAGALLHRVRSQERRPLAGHPTTQPTTDDWQTYKIDCRGDTLKAWVGAEQVLNVRGLVQNVGRVGLQVSRGVISVRNLEMQEQEPPDPEPPPGVLSIKAEGVTLPVPRRQVTPRYTARALAALTQGDVLLAVVIRPDGRVGDARVTRSLVSDLDQEAIAAAKQWVFEPARQNGTPVAVQVTIELSFTVK